jgi:hypothetical protein
VDNLSLLLSLRRKKSTLLKPSSEYSHLLEKCGFLSSFCPSTNDELLCCALVLPLKGKHLKLYQDFTLIKLTQNILVVKSFLSRILFWVTNSRHPLRGWSSGRAAKENLVSEEHRRESEGGRDYRPKINQHPGGDPAVKR